MSNNRLQINQTDHPAVKFQKEKLNNLYNKDELLVEEMNSILTAEIDLEIIKLITDNMEK